MDAHKVLDPSGKRIGWLCKECHSIYKTIKTAEKCCRNR